MDLISTTNATLTSIAKAIDWFKNDVAGHMTDNSLTSITKLTRAEPLTIISNDCSNLEYLPDVLNTVCSMYSAYFLQAVAMLTRVNNVEIVRILDRLNPDRDSTGFLLQGRHTVIESADTLLKQSYVHSLPTRRIMALEDTVESGKEMITVANQKTVYETANLAVGKLLNVSIVVKDKNGCDTTLNVPVSVRLAPALLNEESLVHIFTHRKADTGLVERYHSWRSGRISLISDMIFCQDLINEYRRAAIKDKTGTLQEIVRRVNNSRTFGLLTKNPSLATASNIYILTKDSAQAIEGKTGLRFNNAKDREKILKDTYAMVVAVIDQEWEQVTFYFNGIAASSTMKVRSLKISSNSKGPDITDVMKSLLEGRAPTF